MEVSEVVDMPEHMDAHGFEHWTDTEYHDQYPEFIRPDGSVDLDGLHARDHRVNQWDLEHEHEAV